MSIKQWQIDAEVKNVGSASPFYGQQSSGSVVKSNPTTHIVPKSTPSATQAAGYNPYGAKNPGSSIYPTAKNPTGSSPSPASPSKSPNLLNQLSGTIKQVSQLMHDIPKVTTMARINQQTQMNKNIDGIFKDLDLAIKAIPTTRRTPDGKTISQGFGQSVRNLLTSQQPPDQSNPRNMKTPDARMKAQQAKFNNSWVGKTLQELNRGIDPVRTTAVPWNVESLNKALAGNPQDIVVRNPLRVTDDYYSPRSGGRSHSSLDVILGFGDPIAAKRGGIVVGVDYDSSRGNSVWIKDPQTGEIDVYSHFGSRQGEGINVNPGDVVGFGTILGTSGNSGKVQSSRTDPGAGAHLDYMINQPGSNVGDWNPVTSQRLYETTGYDPQTRSLNSEWANLYKTPQEMQAARLQDQQTLMSRKLSNPFVDMFGDIKPESQWASNPQQSLYRSLSALSNF